MGTRSVGILAAITGLMGFAGCAAPPAGDKSEISGQVVLPESLGGDPITSARVELVDLTGETPGAVATTDGTGRFRAETDPTPAALVRIETQVRGKRNKQVGGEDELITIEISGILTADMDNGKQFNGETTIACIACVKVINRGSLDPRSITDEYMGRLEAEALTQLDTVDFTDPLSVDALAEQLANRVEGGWLSDTLR